MKKIQNMLKLKPEAEKLNLSFLQIESLDDIIYELFHFERLKEIDLSCNRLRKLPIDMSVLKTVERIDLTNNLFDNIEQVLTALNTLPALKEININYDPKALKYEFRHYLPRVEVVNGEVKKAGGTIGFKNPIVRQTHAGIEIEKPKTLNEAVSDCFMIYEDELINLRLFHQNVSSIIKDSSANSKSQSKNFLEKVQSFDTLIKSSYDFNANVEAKMREKTISKKIDTYFLKKTFLFNLFKEYNALIRERSPKIAATNEQIFQLIDLFLTNVESKYSKFDEDFERKSVEEEPEAEAPKVIENSGETERTLLKLKLAELENEIDDLRKENDEMYRFLINSTKKDVIEFAKKMNKNTYENALETRRLDQTTTTAGGKANNLLFMKSYTQRQINDLITDILTSKRAYDERTGGAKAAPETLESYLFIYFQQKYGLKDLIFVEVSSVIEKIKSFAGKSVEIETFRRILKNEVDELFFWHLQNLKADFKTKLEEYYKDKVKRSATAAEAGAWAASKVNGGLTRDEADHLLGVSYKGTELKNIRKGFKVYFDENSEKKGGEELVSYPVFFEFVLGFELNKHLEQLSSVSEFFAKQDENKQGFISRKHFLNFLDVFALRNIQINPEQILAQADSSGLNKISFSKLVEVLSASFPEKDKSRSLLSLLNTL
jgi:hypothetical protein